MAGFPDVGDDPGPDPPGATLLDPGGDGLPVAAATGPQLLVRVLLALLAADVGLVRLDVLRTAEQ